MLSNQGPLIDLGQFIQLDEQVLGEDGLGPDDPLMRHRLNLGGGGASSP